MIEVFFFPHQCVNCDFYSLYSSPRKPSELTDLVQMVPRGSLLASPGVAGEDGGALRALIHSSELSRTADVAGQPRTLDVPAELDAIFRWGALQPHQPGFIYVRREDHRCGGLREVLCGWSDFSRGLNKIDIIISSFKAFLQAQTNLRWLRNLRLTRSLILLSEMACWWKSSTL